MSIFNRLKFNLLLLACLFSCVAHSECIKRTYQIYGVVKSATGLKIPAAIRFSWSENKNKVRNLSVLTDTGDYSATLHFDTQSKADKASDHRLYNCDAKLTSVNYVIKATDYSTLQGSVKLSGLSAEANFVLPNPSIKRDWP